MSRRTSLFTAVVGVGLLVGSTAAPAKAETISELLAAARHPPKEPEPALKLARSLRRAGLTREAINVARSGFAKARSNESIAELRLEIARNHIDEREQKRALFECNQIHKLSAVREKVCFAEAQLLHRRGSMALPAAEEALKLAPNDYDAMVAKGSALRQLGKPAEAEAALKAAISSKPGRHEARLALAGLFFDRREAERGIDVLREASVKTPSEPEVLILLGTNLPANQEAARILTRALELRPSAAAARARLGEVLLALGDEDGAEAALRTALKADSRQAGWHAALGRVYLKRGDAKKALESARTALKIVANHAAAKLLEANALAAQGEIDLAIVAYEAAYGLARTSPHPLVDAARSCLEHGRPTTARAFADRATQDFPTWGPGWVVAGDVAVKADEKSSARRAYKLALSAQGPVDKAAVRSKLAKLK